MEKINVIVISSTGASKLRAFLYLQSGILEFLDSPSWSSVTAEKALGKAIVTEIAEPEVVAPLVEEVPAVEVEKVKTVKKSRKK